MIIIKEKIYLHRGYYNNKTIPENSIKAFKIAKELNLNIEIDIRELKDKTIVVFHDKNLLRMCNKNIKINSITKKDLNKYNLLNTNYKIPTLIDILNIINSQVNILIEIKHLSKNNYKNFINIINTYKGKILIQSFNKKIISYLYKQNIKQNLGILLTPLYPITKYIYKPKYKQIDFISLNKYSINNKLYKEIKNKEKKIILWTIKSKEELSNYINLSDYFVISKFI